MTDLREEFLSLVARVAPDADLAAIDPRESLREQIDIDSMDLLRLARAVHERLGVDVPEIDYPRLDTIDGAVAYLAARGAAAATDPQGGPFGTPRPQAP